MTRLCARHVQLALIAITTAFAPSTARADRPDLSKVDRTIAKQPEYVCKEPLYALLVFGPEVKTRVWVVLDKSNPDQPVHDVAYVDLDQDGDLTSEDERFVAREINQITFDGEVIHSTDIRAGSVRDLESGKEHDLRIFTDSRPGLGAFVKWNSKYTVSIGFDEAPTSRWRGNLGKSPDQATIFWPGGEEPLSFIRHYWPGMDERLYIGKENEVHVFPGHHGLGKGTFSALDIDFFPLDFEIQATLTYSDTDGKERRYQAKLRERC